MGWGGGSWMGMMGMMGLACLGTILKDYLDFYVTDMEPGELLCFWESLCSQFANMLPFVI